MRLFKAAKVVGRARESRWMTCAVRRWTTLQGESHIRAMRLNAKPSQHLNNFNRAAALGAALELHRSLEQ